MNTDLKMLYRALDIDVNSLSSKISSFSSNMQDSVLSPVPINEKDVSLEKQRAHSFHVKKDVRFANNEDTSVVAYESHPLIDLVTKTDVRPKCSGCDDRMCDGCSETRVKWSPLTHIYIGSITVIGLYAVFRALHR